MMSSGPLCGLTVLVLEDEYILAADVADILKAAGARVLGPFGHADDALRQLDRETPDCALVDVNLGHGPDFEMARHIAVENVPFAFVTAYGPEVMPVDLRDRPRVQKPADPAEIVATVRSACEESVG